ncbi:MAG: hypothetical protein E6K80_05825 [Candidatus Eisenbacteria bacterium]|uniref:Uncharacterized protein n=1 Tax=Eiseniibacteriota bacterium TaxID=2212470 RepID=A0A538U6P9_UNCEI|nr:MAG: hypothetical protein E6K80_05825 [Candidatus Eisenbacteria bacterium]
MSSGVPDAPAWWAEPGRPGFEPDQASGVVYPWVLAGHVRGAWAIEDPDLPELGPFPGIMGVQTPLGWADSLEVESGADQGWDGYHAALAKVRVRRSLPGRVRARTRSIGDMTLGSGSDALDGNGLGVAVGDSANWWRMGTLSWTRGGLGDLGPAGRHHYSFGSVWTRGSHALSGRIAQAGSAAELVSGESQSVTGAGGSLRYQYALDHSALGLEAARGYDHHESFGGLLSGSRRDAHQRRATAEWIGDEERWGLRIDARDEWVTRVTPGVGEIPWKARSLWAAGRIEGRRGPASVEASAGGGRNGALRGNAFAPSLRLRFGDGAWTTSVHAGRVLAPVWSDLAPGEAPFLQSTWNGGADVAVRGGPGRRLEIEWLTGRTVGRALLLRFPFEELWLRDGYREDPSAFQFGLATARACSATARRLRWRSIRSGAGTPASRPPSGRSPGISACGSAAKSPASVDTASGQRTPGAPGT